ncbi:hypothetical protein BDW67DRAFT_163049 [Aspergillus spinulosporus]
MGRFANIDTRDPAVFVTTWFLVVVAALSVLIRVATKCRVFRQLTSDDYLIIAALALCIAQSAVISVAVAHGYGDRFTTVASADFVQVMKCQYAASILYIASLCLSKLSLSRFIHTLTPVHRDHLLAAVLQVAIAILGVTGIIGTAFQCRIPQPWDYWWQKCFDLCAWAYFLSAANIATDVAIIVQALLLIFGIQAAWKKKFMFASIFLSRILLVLPHSSSLLLRSSKCQSLGKFRLTTKQLPSVIIPLIAEMVFTHEARNPDSDDPTYASCLAQIASQIVQSMSILTACWGQVNPFLNQLKSNGLRIRGVEYQSSAGTGGKGQASASRSFGYSKGQQSRSHRIRGEEHYELVPVTIGQSETTVEAAGSQGWDADADGDADSRSCSSRTGIIREMRI